MLLSTSKVANVDEFLEVFSTKGAERRRHHGSKGATVFRDPNDPDRVWVVFDWDAEGFKGLLTDPEMPAVFQEAGVQGRPQAAELLGRYDA